MKFKNTFLSIVRHTLTTVGGVLIANPDPRYQAIGAGLVAIGGLWGAGDESKAENPGAKPGAGVAPVLVFCLLASGLCIGFTGCASAPGAAPAPVRTELAAYTLTKNAGLLVLAKEPGAADELRAVAAGVDTVFTLGTLSPQQLATFLDALHVRPESRLLIGSALSDAYNLYTATTGKPLVDASDPTAAAILKGVRRGIDDALAFSAAFQPAK